MKKNIISVTENINIWRAVPEWGTGSWRKTKIVATSACRNVSNKKQAKPMEAIDTRRQNK